jgi:thymidine kinase
MLPSNPAADFNMVDLRERSMAKLYFRFEAMNCGTSTALIQVDNNYRERGMNTLLIKPGTDLKADNLILSRLDISRRVDILAATQGG